MITKATKTLSATTLTSLLAATNSADAGIVYKPQQYTVGVSELLMWDIDGSSSFIVSNGGNSGVTTLFSNNPNIEAAAVPIYIFGAQGPLTNAGRSAYANIVLGTTCTCATGTGPTVALDAVADLDTATETTSSVPFVKPLSQGSVVSASGFQNTTGGFGYFTTGPYFLPDTNQFFGFRFSPDGTDNFFGWAQIFLDTEDGTLTLGGWAYNDVADAPISVGAIPEPSTVAAGLGALALGAAGLRRWRKRI